MVYIKHNDGYGDSDFNLLKDFLGLIDTKISEGNKEFKLTRDECVLDTIEYYVGFGFIAVQRYFHSTYPQIMHDKEDKKNKKNKKNKKKDKALNVCPSGLVAVLNAGANFAKHSEEWPIDQELSRQEQITLETFRGNADLSWHPCANKLFTLTQSLSFTSLIPKIEEWRDALDAHQSLLKNTR